MEPATLYLESLPQFIPVSVHHRMTPLNEIGAWITSVAAVGQQLHGRPCHGRTGWTTHGQEGSITLQDAVVPVLPTAL